MAKNHKKGDGVKLVGNPSKLINVLFKDATERKAVTAQVTDHGPKQSTNKTTRSFPRWMF